MEFTNDDNIFITHSNQCIKSQNIFFNTYKLQVTTQFKINESVSVRHS